MITTFSQKIAILATGAALSFTVLEANPAQAKTQIIENNLSQLSHQTTEAAGGKSFSNNIGNLQQQRKADLNIKENTLIAQANSYDFKTYWLYTTTNASGFFSIAHGLAGNRIWGVQVAVQHANGNWHTLEFSHTVDNRFWWNNQYVQGLIASPNFYNRPVKIILQVS